MCGDITRQEKQHIGSVLGGPDPLPKPGIPNPWAPKPGFLCVWGGKKVRADPMKNFSDPFFRLGDPRTRLGRPNMCFFKLVLNMPCKTNVF